MSHSQYSAIISNGTLTNNRLDNTKIYERSTATSPPKAVSDAQKISARIILASHWLGIIVSENESLFDANQFEHHVFQSKTEICDLHL